MKKNTILWLLALAPFFSFSQGVKVNLYDKFLQQHRVETETIPVSGLTGKNKLSIGFTALGSAFYLNMTGSGWGTTTIDHGDELILLFSNDSVLTLKSASLQSFEPGVVQNTYHHQYKISTAQLEALGRSDLVSIRKYSFKNFNDLKIPRGNTGKLKKLSVVFVEELKKANLYKSLRQISVKDVRNHIGDSVEFCSRVYKTRYFEGSADGPTLLDVQADFSDPFINVVILQKDRAKFNGAPEKKFLNKEVCISGVLTLQNNVPFLAIHDREQLRMKGAVSLDEVDLFVGDSVSVTGKIFTARYLGDTKSKPTLLNMGAPFPDQPLTLVIENEDRKNFLSPEHEYLYKTLRVTGKVVSFKGKPQIVLTSPQQIEVIAGPDPELVSAAKKQQEAEVAAVPLNAVSPLEEKKEQTAPAIIPAAFPGGSEAFNVFLHENLLYPSELKAGEQKRVVASFEIDMDGNCRNVKIVESAGYVYDNEVKRVLLKMPKWEPAQQNGTFIPMQVTQPVSFKGTEGDLQK